jgi:hypothetical protein
LLHHLLRRIGVVPKRIGLGTQVEFGYGALLAFVVKDAP